METVEFGKTGVKVSRLGFGGAPVGLTNYLETFNPSDKELRDQLVAAIHQALALGITYFDTAPAYGGGLGEEIYGEALAGQPVFIATKVAPRPTTNIRESLESSLKRLRRDKVDLLQFHGTSISQEAIDLILAPGGLLAQLQQLKAEGLVRFIGFTTEDNNAAVYRLLETDAFDMVQMTFNLFFQHPADWTHPVGSMVEADKRGLGIVTMRAMTAGAFQKWVQLVNPDNTFNYSPALLQYVLSNPLVDVALVGMRTPEMVEENVAICQNLAGRIDLAVLHQKFF